MDERRLKIFLNRLIDDADARVTYSEERGIKRRAAVELMAAAAELRDSLVSTPTVVGILDDHELNRLVYDIVDAERQSHPTHSVSYRVWIEDTHYRTAVMQKLYEYVDRIRVEVAADARVSQDENWKTHIDKLRKLLVDANAVIRSAAGWDEDTEWRRMAEEWRRMWRSIG